MVPVDLSVPVSSIPVIFHRDFGALRICVQPIVICGKFIALCGFRCAYTGVCVVSLVELMTFWLLIPNMRLCLIVTSMSVHLSVNGSVTIRVLFIWGLIVVGWTDMIDLPIPSLPVALPFVTLTPGDLSKSRWSQLDSLADALTKHILL